MAVGLLLLLFGMFVVEDAIGEQTTTHILKLNEIKLI